MKTHIIYMAAGNGSRFGGNKLLYQLDGKCLYQHGLDMLKQVLCAVETVDLTVVTRYTEILQQIACTSRISVVFSPESAEGVAYTIQNGIHHATTVFGEADYYLFVVADQPYLSADTICTMLEQGEKIRSNEMTSNAGTGKVNLPVISAAYGNRMGNPCMFPEDMLPLLLSLEKDRGGRSVIGTRKVISVQVAQEKELVDLDFKPE